MHRAALILLLAAAWPITRAWWATARTTLRHSMAWASVAWAAWVLALAVRSDVATYFALSLTGCAGVAVLGARRPGVEAWNFVVVGLLAVLLLPVAQGWGSPRVETPQLLFIGATLGVGVLNYLPTRLAPAVLLVGLGCATELTRLSALNMGDWQRDAAEFCLAAGPWAGFLCRRSDSGSATDVIWLRFRDGFGLVWGQRAREQFNRAAENAGWGVRLGWFGLIRSGTTPGEEELLRTLTAVLKRFGEG